MPSVHDHISKAFQQWEIRGRGWQVFDEPVYPEPPFVPFNLRPMTDTPAVDNGRRPSLLGALFRSVAVPPSPPPPELEPEEEPEPTPLTRDALVEFQASLPAELDISRETINQFLGNLKLCREPIVFELLGIHKRVLVQFVASAEDASLVRKQLQAHFLDVQFRQLEGALEKAWEASAGDQVFVIEFGLEREFMLPLATGKIDPFIGIIGALAELQPGELGLFQTLWQPVHNPWADNIVASVTYQDGKPLFVNAAELTGAAANKVACPLYATVVRMMLRTGTTGRLREIARELAGSLGAFANPQGNALIPLHNEGYPFEEHILDVLRRQTCRSGMILNGEELTGFVHLPSSAVRASALQRDAGKTKAAPPEVQQPSGLVIGDNEHNGETVPVYLSTSQRVRHTHIIGIPGAGKSSLLFNLIRQDIENDQGVGVLDPHGDLIDQILGIIPERRIKDVVLLDLSDTEFPIGFNILQAHTEDEKTLLASDLASVLQRFSSSAWGDQMDTVLQNAVLAFLYSSQGGTLADLRQFLIEAPKRGDFFVAFLQTVQDRETRNFWQNVFPTFGGGKSIGSVLARLQQFFSRKPLRNMVSQRKNMLDFGEIMDTQKIFLARLPEGLNGAENVYLLGSLLVAKFQQLAMARQSQEAEDRKDFWLYVDEFDHFISPSMAHILTGTRKYRLGMTLGHQELNQLKSDSKVASAVTSSVCTRIVLRVGDSDAKILGEGFESFDAQSLKTLAKFHAIVRVEQNDFDFNLALRKPELPPKEQADKRKAEVKAESRKMYGTPRALVEAEWEAGLGTEKPAPPATKPPVRGSAPGAPKPSTTSVVTAPVVAESPKVAEVPKDSAIPNIEPVDESKVQGKRLHEKLKDEFTVEAESLDYTVWREKSIPQHGRPDLDLTRGGRTIACEFSDTTPPEEEADHIRLRLKAGFGHVAVISANRRKLDLIQAAFLKNLGDTDAARVGFYSPNEFKGQLFTWAMDDPEGGRLERGKPRKQDFSKGLTLPPADQREAIEQQLLDYLKNVMEKNRKG